MKTSIDPQIKSIEKYLRESAQLLVPSYQRPYSWTRVQCDKLIEDIANHKEGYDDQSSGFYFFGAVLTASEVIDGVETTVLIDGQQRTTTFMLLLKALQMVLNKHISLISEASHLELKIELEDARDTIIRTLYNLNPVRFKQYTQGMYELTSADIKYGNQSISERFATDMETILLSDSLAQISEKITPIKYKSKYENKYSNFYKNFQLFYKHYDSQDYGNTNIHSFISHLLNNCDVITLASGDTDQAINIFNSLNGTGLPLSPIEVVVSTVIGRAGADRQTFENNWSQIVSDSDGANIDLTTLITHYIFAKLAEGTAERNPGVQAFFRGKNQTLLESHEGFTTDVAGILNRLKSFNDSDQGRMLSLCNKNLGYFVSSYRFHRGEGSETKAYITQLIKLGALLDISDFSYSASEFKGFLEKLNLRYSQLDSYTNAQLLDDIKNHIHSTFERTDIENRLQQSGVAKSVVCLNEYLYAGEKLAAGFDIEHIMPKNMSTWTTTATTAGFADENEIAEYLEKLGNKIPLELEINRALGPAYFAHKRRHTIESKTGYQNSQFAIAKGLVNNRSEHWLKADIDTATEKAAKRIADWLFN